MQTDHPSRAARQPGGPLCPSRPETGAGPAAPEDRTVPRHDARRLTGAGGEATILLDGAAYRLRITRAGKLILTK